jgi:hypothetical protein
MDSIGIADRVAPIARSPLDSARGRRKFRALSYVPVTPPASPVGGFGVKSCILESPTQHIILCSN